MAIDATTLLWFSLIALGVAGQAAQRYLFDPERRAHRLLRSLGPGRIGDAQEARVSTVIGLPGVARRPRTRVRGGRPGPLGAGAGGRAGRRRLPRRAAAAGRAGGRADPAAGLRRRRLDHTLKRKCAVSPSRIT